MTEGLNDSGIGVPVRKRAVTIRDVAKRAGVSVSTVSVTLNPSATATTRVGETTQARVLAAADELGYVPSQLGRGLRRGRSEHVCLVSRYPDSPWGYSLATDLAAVAERHRYSTVALVTGDWLGYLTRQAVDGAIVDAVSDTAFETERLQPLLRRGFALVVLNDHLEPAGFDVVRTNERAACAEAMAYLLEAGHRRIGFLRQSPEDPPHMVPERSLSYMEALETAGIGVDPDLIRDINGSRELAYTATLDLLQQPTPPSAIYAASDLAAISALWAAHRLGMRVPHDVAVLGVGNAPEGTLTEPALTTVGPAHQDFTPVAEMLFERISASTSSPGQVFHQHWELIRRGTA